MNSKIVRENSSTENSKRILKDKFLKELPTNYEIEKMSEKTLEKTINAVLKTFKNGNVRITNIERKDLKEDDTFEDCMVYIDYNIENKKKALKYIYDNILKMLRVDTIKHMNTNMLPYNYNEFFCQNLCPFFKICSVVS